ncbi:hypothetical protein ABO04_05095 [Nitrosomonas sp. HPC101]|nr:hypothetical protein [Nitrosomonas sp. HPC101]
MSVSADRKLIESFGGPARVAELLRYKKKGGTQRVHNWMTRGIPSKVKLDHPDIFLITAEASAPTQQEQP